MEWVQDAQTSRWVRTERFERNFTDLAGQGWLLGQVAGRTGEAVTGWLDDLSWATIVPFMILQLAALLI